MVQPVDGENPVRRGTKIARVLRCTEMKCMYMELKDKHNMYVYVEQNRVQMSKVQ
jgi:hypothetical protein